MSITWRDTAFKRLRQGSELTGLPGLPAETLLPREMGCGGEWYYKENYKTIMLNLKQYGVWAGDTVSLYSIKVEL